MDRTEPPSASPRSAPFAGAWPPRICASLYSSTSFGKNGIARREIREPPPHPDFVALKNPGIALDRLHERAGFALLGSAALAEAAAAQSRLELVDRLGAGGEIVRGEVVGVHGQVGVDPLEPRHHAGERAHVLAETRDRGPRRNGPVPPAGHDQLCRRRRARPAPAPGGDRATPCGRRPDIADAPPRNAARWSSPSRSRLTM